MSESANNERYDYASSAERHTVVRVGSVYLARSAVVAGDVTLGAGCNIWHHAVLRGDVAPIRLGERVNVQDGAVLHCDMDVPLTIGDEVSIGHGALVHGACIGSGTLIGMGAIVLGRSEVGQGCLIAAGALVSPGTRVPPGSVVMGVPGRVVRAVTDEERANILQNVQDYLALAERHAAGGFFPYQPAS